MFMYFTMHPNVILENRPRDLGSRKGECAATEIRDKSFVRKC